MRRRPLRSRSALALATSSGLALALALAAGCGDDGSPVGPDASTIDAPLTDAGVDGAIDAATDASTATGVVQCPTPLAAPTEGDCNVAHGTGTAVVLRGNVLTLGTTYLDGAVAYDGNLITYVGCDPTTAPGFATATVVSCRGAAISPGIINAHDHITYDNRAPLASTVAHDARRYGHRNEWRDAWPTPPNQYGNTASNTDGVRWNELRQVFGGTTSIVGSGHADGMARNLDDVAAAEFALGFKALDYEVFMLGDSSGANAHNIPASCGWAYKLSETEVGNLHSLVTHSSEGIDDRSRAEFQCQRSSFGGARDFVEKNTAHVHVIAANAADYYDMARDHTALLWSPRSNISLFGNTSEAQVLHRLGGTVAVGTDWTYTGSATSLRELACVDELNRTYLAHAFTDEDMWKMVTINGAIASRSDDLTGSIAVGKLADLAIFHADAGETYRAIIAAGDADVALVVRDGDVLYGEADVVAGLDNSCEELSVCTKARRVCAQREFGVSYATLAPRVPLAYPAIICAAPADEPTCLPTRPGEYDGIVAGDQDGDGVLDAADDCPTTFNPIRPMDHGAQADVDHDGMGDACDPTPVGTDLDGDGTANATDVCPFLTDPQTDTDMDHKGDLCDACPMTPNPDTVCPAVTVATTIYNIKQGVTPVGTVARVTNVIVTGKGSNGFFIQVKATLANGMPDPVYVGSDYSGIFVFTGPNSAFLTAVAVGNRVTVDGTITLFSGQLEIAPVANVTVDNAAVEAAPTPVMATAAEVTTGGTRATKLESVLVRIGGARITALNAAFGEFTAMETGGGSLIVDDFLFLLANPAVNQTFASLTGVLALRTNDSKLEPRSAADLPAGAVGLVGFAPTPSFVRQGQAMAPTIPTPLTVSLSQAATMDTFVAITSGTPAALTVVGGGVTIPTGQASAQVLVNGLAQNAGVTLTATLGAASLMATVRVIGAGEVPSVVTLSPATATAAPGGTVTLTARIDLPAPAGGRSIALALVPANAGAIPATVTVPANQLSVTFNYVDASMVGSATITATLAASTSSATITISAAVQHLVINEVDYDQSVNPDAAEFIEIYNPSAAAVSLVGKAVVLLNGSSTPNPEYRRVLLATAGNPAGMLPAGGYLVIGAAAVTAMGTGIKFTPAVADWPATDAFQNGAPDGVALIDVSTSTLIDALAYEGAMPTASIMGFPAAVSLTEGTFLPIATADSGTAMGSLCRLPNGTDTDNAATDWNFTTTATPGIANVP